MFGSCPRLKERPCTPLKRAAKGYLLVRWKIGFDVNPFSCEHVSFFLLSPVFPGSHRGGSCCSPTNGDIAPAIQRLPAKARSQAGRASSAQYGCGGLGRLAL